MIRQLLYVSRATEGLAQRDIDDILAVSRRSNERRDITGCLLFAGGTFAQVLEGEASAVTALTERIAQDLRHYDVRTVLERDAATRDYANWSMGFVYDLNLEDDIAALLDGGSVSVDPLQLMERIRPDTVLGAL